MRRLTLAMPIVFLAACISGTTSALPVSTVEPTPTPLGIPNPALFQAIDLVSRTTGWVAIEDTAGRALLRTTDGGDHWERLPLATGSTHQLKFVDAKTGWLLGAVDDPAGCVGGSCSEAVLKTIDGGQTWKQVVSGNAGSFGLLSAVDGEHAWVVRPGPGCGLGWDGCSGEVLGTSNATTWRPLATIDGQMTSLQFVDAMTGWMVVRTSIDASILVTHDGGASWARQFHASGSAPMLQISFVNTRDGWALGSDLSYCAMGGCGGYTLYATTDGGASWTTLQRPETTWWGPIPPLASAGGFLGAPQFTSATSGWIRIDTGAGAGSGGVLVTADGGRTWRRSNGDSGVWSVSAVVPVDANVVVAMVQAYEGSTYTTFLARTIDGALTWQRLPLAIAQ